MNLNEMAQTGQPEETSQAKPASEKQQRQFDLLLGRCRQVLGESADQWLQALEVDPVQAAVKMGTQTLRTLAMQSEEAGTPVDPAVLLHVGVTLVKDVAGIANEAGLVPDDKLEGYLQEVMQLSIAEYMRMDADEGLMQGGETEPALPGDPQTPDDTTKHEVAESPALEQREIAAEPAETGQEGMSEEDEMAMQLARIRAQKGGAR